MSTTIPESHENPHRRIDFGNLTATMDPEAGAGQSNSASGRVHNFGSAVKRSIKENPGKWVAVSAATATLLGAGDLGLATALGTEISKNDQCQTDKNNQTSQIGNLTSEINELRDKYGEVIEKLQSAEDIISSLNSTGTTTAPTTVTVTQTASGGCGTTTDTSVSTTLGQRSAYPGSAVTAFSAATPSRP